MDSTGQDTEMNVRWSAEAKRSRSGGQGPSKLVGNILGAVKNENLGFSDRQLLPAIESLIETYGTDDAYKWITKDNFAVLINFILESPHKALDGCSASLSSAEYLCRKKRFDQFPVTHSDKSIELGSRVVVTDKAEQGIATASKYASSPVSVVRKKQHNERYVTDGDAIVKKGPVLVATDKADQGIAAASKYASSPVNVARKKQHKERYVTDGHAIVNKRPVFKNHQGDMSCVEHRARKIIEEGKMSLSINREADLPIPLQKRQKKSCVPSDSCSTLFEEKPHNRSEKLRESRPMQEASFSRKHGYCTDIEVPCQQMTQHLRTSEPHSNAECFAGSPTKGGESSRPKSLHDEGYTVKKKKFNAHMHVKGNYSSNSKIVVEGKKLQSADKSKCAIDNQVTLPDELSRSFKVHSVGNGRDTKSREFSIKKSNHFVAHSGVDKSCDESVILPGNIRPILKTKVVSDYVRNKVIAHGSKDQISGKESGNYVSSFLQELKIASAGGLRTEFSADALHFFSDWNNQQGKAPTGNADSKDNQCSLEERTLETVDVAQGRKKKVISLSNEKDGDGNLLSLDISRGLERKKITCVNEFDSTVFPEDFLYINRSIITAAAHVDTTLSRIGDMHCSCSGNCLTSTTPCKCTDDTRGEYAYDEDGLLIPRLSYNYCSRDGFKNRADFITECNIKCRCSAQCGNRVVQRGLKYRLQVFMTKEGKGWGLRTLEPIPARAFLFEYIGEIMTNTEQYYRNMEYARNNIHTYTMLLDADYDMETKHFKDGLNDDEALTLDATRYGNLSRFVNHRCTDPNLFIRPVQIETRDTHYYHVAFFAHRDISVMEELTWSLRHQCLGLMCIIVIWDYGINFDDQHEVKGFRCLCGSEFCRDLKNKAL